MPASPNSATGVLLISGEGTILARSGPAAVIGQPPHTGGYADLPSAFRAQDDVDLLALVAEVAKGDGSTTPSLLVRPVAPGAASRVRLTLHPVADGLVVGVLAEADLPFEAETAAETLDLVWEGLTEGMVVASTLESLEGPTVVGANQAFASLFRVPREEVLFRPLTRFLAPMSGSALTARIQEQVIAEGKTISDVTVVKRPTGESALLAWELAPVRGPSGRTLGLVAIVRDRTLAAERDPIYRSLDVDPLSGLPNHAHLMSRLERAVELATQTRPYGFALIGIEMRGLRAVERRLGTLMANTVLEALVRRLELRLRPGDLIARTGERRLAILLDHFSPWGTTEEVLSRIREVTGHPYTIAGERITMSALGVAGPVWSGERPPHDAQAVLDALERSVTYGQNGVKGRVAHIGTPPAEGQRAADLSGIAESGQLRLAYLPLVSLATGRLIGLEALVQWAHPDRGLLAGHDFLEAAEQAGQILSIDRWVLREACRQVQAWGAGLAADAVPPVHVNLSAQEFWDHDLVANLRRLTEEMSVDASLIRLEVPESAVARGVPSACRVLADLAEAGFEPWLDRFGEGGIRLRDLPTLPVKHVKLAPGLVWGAGGEVREPSPLLRSLLAIGHDLGWEASVAGVETQPQQDALRHAACDVAQGFYYSGLLDSAGAVALARRSAVSAEAPRMH